MGKTAKNEQIRLRAAFYNNLAAGLIGAGAFIPYFTIYPKLHLFDLNELQNNFHALWPIVGAVAVGFDLRRRANRTITQLED